MTLNSLVVKLWPYAIVLMRVTQQSDTAIHRHSFISGHILYIVIHHYIPKRDGMAYNLNDHVVLK